MRTNTDHVLVTGAVAALAETHLRRIVGALDAIARRTGGEAQLHVEPNGRDALLVVRLWGRDLYGPAAPELVHAFLRGLDFGTRHRSR